MKKLILTLLSIATMVACAPVESSFSTSGTFLYTLRAEFDKDGLEIGSPDERKAKFKADSALLDYVVNAKLGGTRGFSAAGSTPAEMQNMLHQQIKKTFDSLAPQVALLDVDELIEPCEQYCGGVARLVYVVTPYTSDVVIIGDTIVETKRINFRPAVESRWVASTDGAKYAEYVFGQEGGVTVVFGGVNLSTTYAVDIETGVYTLAAVEDLPEHTLTFKSEKSKPAFRSSLNDVIYLLK